MRSFLKVSADILIELCKGLRVGEDAREFKVVENGLPLDVTFLSVEEILRDGGITIVVESPSFQSVRELPTPVLQLVEHSAPSMTSEPSEQEKEEPTEFSISKDACFYFGRYATKEQAIAAGVLDIGKKFYIGICENPPPPETYWEAEDWLENVSCSDEYSDDWAEGWDDSTKEQREELEAEVRTVLAAWLERHNLRPQFHNIDPSSVEEYCVDVKKVV